MYPRICTSYLTIDVIAVVEDTSKFLNDFEDVPCRVWWGDPIGISSSKYGIPIIQFQYSNGDYELIAYNGMAECTGDGDFRNYVGYRIFDKKAFDALIEKYSGGIRLDVTLRVMPLMFNTLGG